MLRKVLLIATSLVLIAIAYLTARECWFITASISDDLIVRQVPFSDRYNLVDSNDGHVIVADVDGWYFEGAFVIGSNGSEAYYSYDRACRSMREFHSITELQAFLRPSGVSGYSYGRERSTGDLERGLNRFSQSRVPMAAHVPLLSVPCR